MNGTNERSQRPSPRWTDQIEPMEITVARLQERTQSLGREVDSLSTFSTTRFSAIDDRMDAMERRQIKVSYTLEQNLADVGVLKEKVVKVCNLANENRDRIADLVSDRERQIRVASWILGHGWKIAGAIILGVIALPHGAKAYLLTLLK